MAVERRVGRGEDDRAVERREDALPWAARLRVPQLEVAAVLLAPILVQVGQHVRAAVELQLRMDVEVGVHLQEAARLDLVQSAAAEVGIGDQAADAGEGLEEKQHLEAV